MLRCAITDRRRLAPPGAEEIELRRRLRRLAAAWSQAGVDFIQVREKDLSPASLRMIAGEIVSICKERAVAGAPRRTKVLVNCQAAPEALAILAPVADGLHISGSPHLRDAEIARRAFHNQGRGAILSMACHSLKDVIEARRAGADLVLFAPVFDKPIAGGAALPGHGLDMLALACRAAEAMPVLALGGVSAENAAECVAAGAAGVAGIRLFAGEEWRGLAAAQRGAPAADI